MIIAQQGQSLRVGQAFALQSGLLSCLSPNFLATSFFAMLILVQTLSSSFAGQDDPQTRKTMNLLQSFLAGKPKAGDPHDYKYVDPLQDNLLVFSLYKGLAHAFAFFGDGQVPEYENNRIAFALILKGLALLM